ncbi:MAG: glycosyltransferase family A protein [Burkholderiaceae bacterium]
MSPAASFSVVIPYFQREAGVLRRSLRSILAQSLVAQGEPLHIVVVDDASPCPADPELDGLDLPESVRLSLIRQANAGPGGARNTGLDALAAEPGPGGHIALLDSDDEWLPAHLENARAALQAGASAYFADHFQLGQQVSAFTRNGTLRLDEHPLLDAQRGLHWFGLDMPAQVIGSNLIGTSTVCFDAGALRLPRFRTELRRAGEDYLFWIELARAGARWAFGSRPEVRYGRGVNVYSGVRWGSPEFIERSRHEWRWRQTSLGLVPAGSPLQAHVADRIARLRQDIWLSALSSLRAGRPPLGELLRGLRDDPALLGQLLPALRRRGGGGGGEPGG